MRETSTKKDIELSCDHPKGKNEMFRKANPKSSKKTSLDPEKTMQGAIVAGRQVTLFIYVGIDE